jgi:hypothetical protein
MDKELQPLESQFLLYTSPNGDIKVDVFFQDETIWLSQKKMAELFNVQVPAINKHLKNIFEDGELEEDSVISKMETTANDGKKYLTNFYNLDAIIAVGYRVNSYEATQFRMWATKTLKEFMIKGFVMDDERLKNGTHFGKDYFDELLERIREIRASERRFYQKITDIYAQCSIDYDSKSPVSQEFYAAAQNKLHWAITHHTAPELIKERADATKPKMGLQTWKNAPKGKILKPDVSIAKNYLNEDELKKLNRIVTMYLDYAESQAERQIPMKMADWAGKLDAFLEFNELKVLKDAGKVQKKVAKRLAETEYEKFRVVQDQAFVSDFDKVAKKALGKGKLS